MAKGTHRRLSIRFKTEVYEQLELLSNEIGVGVGTVVQFILGSYLRNIREVEPKIRDSFNSLLSEVLKDLSMDKSEDGGQPRGGTR